MGWTILAVLVLFFSLSQLQRPRTVVHLYSNHSVFDALQFRTHGARRGLNLCMSLVLPQLNRSGAKVEERFSSYSIENLMTIDLKSLQKMASLLSFLPLTSLIPLSSCQDDPSSSL